MIQTSPRKTEQQLHVDEKLTASFVYKHNPANATVLAERALAATQEAKLKLSSVGPPAPRLHLQQSRGLFEADKRAKISQMLQEFSTPQHRQPNYSKADATNRFSPLGHATKRHPGQLVAESTTNCHTSSHLRFNSEARTLDHSGQQLGFTHAGVHFADDLSRQQLLNKVSGGLRARDLLAEDRRQSETITKKKKKLREPDRAVGQGSVAALPGQGLKPLQGQGREKLRASVGWPGGQGQAAASWGVDGPQAKTMMRQSVAL